MRARLSILLASLLLAGLAGCKGKTKKLSEHPYFLDMLNKRWGVVRGSFQSENPDIGFCPVLLKDLSGAAEAMSRTYHGPNRDQAIAKLKELTGRFRADLDTKVIMRGGTVTLVEGATVKGVGEAIERAYQEYLEFQKLIG
jgi:hypothetical protein